mmetsp:Transcript_9129/g.21940  ORF Transcript_9129/g.21940 Transcript_9129/m.21940 type:complete len:201 (-) Transcript_9129:316-918(-)
MRTGRFAFANGMPAPSVPHPTAPDPARLRPETAVSTPALRYVTRFELLRKPTPRHESSSEPSSSSVSIWKATPKKSWMWRSVSMAKGVSGPNRMRETSSGPSAMSSSAVGWLALSTTPASLICSSSASAAALPTSSGSTPPAPTTSAESSAPLVVSATSVRPNPGERPDVLPLWMSVYTQTSGRKRFITPRDASTRRLAT